MMYDGEVLMIAMAATALLVIALTLFAFQVLALSISIFSGQRSSGQANYQRHYFRLRSTSLCAAGSSSVFFSSSSSSAS